MNSNGEDKGSVILVVHVKGGTDDSVNHAIRIGRIDQRGNGKYVVTWMGDESTSGLLEFLKDLGAVSKGKLSSEEFEKSIAAKFRGNILIRQFLKKNNMQCQWVVRVHGWAGRSSRVGSLRSVRYFGVQVGESQERRSGVNSGEA